MKINEKVVGIFLVVLFVLGIPTAKEMGLWITESNKVPVKMIVEGQEVYNPEDIRGSYAFKDVSEVFEIPIEVLGEAFEVPDNIDLNTLLNKDLEARIVSDEGVEVGNGSVKLFVAFYLDLPYDYANADDYLPRDGVKILKSLEHMSEDQKAYLETHMATIRWDDSDEEGHSINEEVQIKGKTTFLEVMEMGLSKEQIKSVVGGTFLTNESVKDYCLEKGLSFSEVKTELLRMIE